MAFYGWKAKRQKKVSKKIHFSISMSFLSHYRYLNLQTSVSKSKDTQQPYPQMALKLSFLFWEGYHKKKKKISFPLPKSISRMKGVFCIWKNSRKHLAQFIREKQKIKQLRKKKEWWNKFWKITKVQLEKLPTGEKAPQWPGKKKVQVCYILLWDQKDREEKWPQFTKRAIKVSLDTLKQTVSMQTGDTLVLYGRIYCNLRQ